MVLRHPDSCRAVQHITHVESCTHISPCQLHWLGLSPVALGELASAYIGLHLVGHAVMLETIYPSVRIP